MNSWDGIVKKLKDEYSKTGLDKDVFISLIQSMRDNFNNTLNPAAIRVTERGQQRQQQMAALEQERKAKAEDERAMLVNQKGMFDEEVNQRQQAKEAEDLRQQLQRRKNLFKKGIPSLKAAARQAMQPTLQQPSQDFDLEPLTDPTDQQPRQPMLSQNFDLYSLVAPPEQPDSSYFKYNPNTFELNENLAELWNSYMETYQETIKNETEERLKDIVDSLYRYHNNKMQQVDNNQQDDKLLLEFLAYELYDLLANRQIEAEGTDEEKQQEEPQPQLQTPPPPPSENLIEYYNGVVFDELIGMRVSDLIEYAEKHNISLKGVPKIKNTIKTFIEIARVNQLMTEHVGYGFRKRRKIVGRGYSSSEEDKPVRKNTIPKKVINGKFIDLNKLKNNILTVRYLKTGGFVPTVKSQHISNDVKSVIEDIINDKFEKRLYEKLQPDEKRLVKRLVGALKIDIDVNTKEDDEYRKQFEIVLGEFQAGNTSPAIKNKLKQYVAESMQSGMITRREAWQLLYELTINN